ncbi:hypothetical protein PR048_024526 [Dryococelus australis]|uniref:Uncharacterized protein n=1 Tax=Dryococelus australis TaxID=614101 RepID=A0ABQ9GNU4_9NEOP|nr:hypothetical protein PR048_024526 [Dryococelus australis]
MEHGLDPGITRSPEHTKTGLIIIASGRKISLVILWEELKIFPNTGDASRRAEAPASLTRTFLRRRQTHRNLQQGRGAVAHVRRRARCPLFTGFPERRPATSGVTGGFYPQVGKVGHPCDRDRKEHTKYIILPLVRCRRSGVPYSSEDHQLLRHVLPLRHSRDKNRLCKIRLLHLYMWSRPPGRFSPVFSCSLAFAINHERSALYAGLNKSWSPWRLRFPCRRLNVTRLGSTVSCTNTPMSTAHWLSAATVEGDDWASVLQEVSNTVWTNGKKAKQPPVPWTRQQNGVTYQQDAGTPFANQRLVTCSPAGSPFNRGTFRSRQVANQTQAGPGAASQRVAVHTSREPPRHFVSVYDEVVLAVLGRGPRMLEESPNERFPCGHIPQPLDALNIRSGVVVRLLASSLGEQGSVPGGVAPGFSPCCNRAGQCLCSAGFLGDPLFHPLYLPLLHTHLASPPSALETSMLRATQISSLASSRQSLLAGSVTTEGITRRFSALRVQAAGRWARTLLSPVSPYLESRGRGGDLEPMVAVDLEMCAVNHYFGLTSLQRFALIAVNQKQIRNTERGEGRWEDVPNQSSGTTKAEDKRWAVEPGNSAGWMKSLPRQSAIPSEFRLYCRTILHVPARLPPTRTGFDLRPGRRIFASGNRAGRCLWSTGLLGDLPFPPPSHSGASPYSLQSPSSALKHLYVNSSPNLFTHSLYHNPKWDRSGPGARALKWDRRGPVARVIPSGTVVAQELEHSQVGP